MRCECLTRWSSGFPSLTTPWPRALRLGALALSALALGCAAQPPPDTADDDGPPTQADVETWADDTSPLSAEPVAAALDTLARADYRSADARSELQLPGDTPAYFRAVYRSMMRSPRPVRIYDTGGVPRYVRSLEIDPDPSGRLGSYHPDGDTDTSQNAFFQPLGTNGRSCVTCHQPPSGMSVSVRNIQRRLHATCGRDPIFAPVDGANCPNQVPTSGSPSMADFKAAHSLLIHRGLFRIALPVPPDAEYQLEVVDDPSTCNLDRTYSVNDDGTQIVSVFRRPLISSNLHFKTTTLDLAPGSSPLTSIMFDGREPTLFTQATDATLGHAQATQPPTQDQLDQIVAFETGIFSAQRFADGAGLLDAAGATGGPVALSSHGQDAPVFGVLAFDEYDAWSTAKSAERQSIARGQKLFLGTGGQSGDRGSFAISNVAGFSDFPGIPNPLPGQSCSTCHNFAHAGSDILARSQRDIGIGGQASAIGGPNVSAELPVFKLTCPAGSFLWDPLLTTVFTNDPGKALITGKCRDIGARSVPSLRALAAHEPYFSDGSAATLLDVVNFYDRRFAIGLTSDEKRDLVNFLNAL